MSFYEDRILPHLIHWGCGQKDVAEQRQKVVPEASGRVLEVGMGSGLNLPFYDPEKVELVWGLEPSEGMRRKAAKALGKSPVDVHWIVAGAEDVPLESGEVDTVVLTFTLCTIPDWRRALGEVRRVLRPGGRLLFAEHGLSPDEGVAKWQRRIEPFSKPLGGGCHLTRPTVKLLEEGGFRLDEVDSAYLDGPRWAAFTTWGSASVG